MTGESKTSARRVHAAERRIEAVAYGTAGATYEQIGERLGCSRAVAHKLVTQELSRIREETAEQADELRTLELSRLDALWMRAFDAVRSGNVRAIDQCIRVMERRARLAGLDAATRQEITGNLTTSHEWIELRGVLIQVLGKYPEAQRAVLAAITGGNGGNGK
jgi:VIT1/CCC1 family predicted Fe2+/Mn2+ transporter